jgi:hypothetical protein
MTRRESFKLTGDTKSPVAKQSFPKTERRIMVVKIVFMFFPNNLQNTVAIARCEKVATRQQPDCFALFPV